MNLHRIWILVSLGLVVLGCSKSYQENPLEIKFNSTSYVRLTLINVSQPFDLQLDYYPNLSREIIYTPTYPIDYDTTILVGLIAHMPQRHNFTIQNIQFPVFLTTDDTIEISLDLKNKMVGYSGKNKHINEYYYSIHEQLSSNLTEMIQLHGDPKRPWKEIYAKMDSIAEVKTDLLLKTKALIPEWFMGLELKRIKFSTAQAKLSGPNYRNFLSTDNRHIPDKKNYDFLEKLDLQSPYNGYLKEFYSFMNFYAAYKIYGANYVIHDSVTQLFNDRSLATSMFQVFENEVRGENLMAFEVDNTLRDISKNSVRKDGRLQYLRIKYGEANKFVKYLSTVEEEMPDLSLKKGDKAPGFYLDNGLEAYHSLEEQKGKVVLLNFYTRGCKPCFKEVPFEKKLLKKYEGKNFKIINICVTNSAEEFERAVKKFQMEGLNLFTQGNWKESLPKKYYLSGYPHYCLIDIDGMVIMNHAYRPSNPDLEKLINVYIPK